MASFYKRWYGVDLDPDSEIQPLIGSKEGILHITLALVNVGDKVLVPNPGYPTYTATVAKYCDLMCALPGGIARLNGVAAPAVKPVLIANAESQPVPTKAISD